MRNTTTLLLLAAGLVLGATGPAAADVDPATTVKPFVLLLLDTSGSMEYESGTGGLPSEDFAVPVCEEPGTLSPSQPVGSYARSRLIVAKEVLTGSIDDYWCQYDHRDDDPDRPDFLYPIPHVRACSGDTGTGCEPPVQQFDGLMDIFRDEIKFGLMTFDSFDSPDSGEDGMWSYAPNTGLGFNLGARNKRWGVPNAANNWNDATGTWVFADEDRSTNNRGQLIPPSRADEFGDVRDANRLAQYEVNSTMGFWGTPLAPILTDARWFLMNDNAVRPFSPNSNVGDPYANCRPRTVVLITDGRASQGEGVLGYPTTATAIEELKDTPPAPVKVYVVGFNLADEDDSMLDDLDPDNGGPATGVFRANTSGELAEALTTIFSEVQPVIQSRTEVRFTNATHSDVDLQYQFNAAFQADPDVPTNLIGFLDQTIFRCDDACSSLAETGLSCARDLVEVHTRLNERVDDTRDVLAAVRGEAMDLDEDLASWPADKETMEEVFGVPQTGDLPQVDPDHFDSDGIPVPSQDVIGPADGLAHQREYLRQLIALVRGDDHSMRRGEHMGAVTHTTPVIQEPVPVGRHPITSWNTYVRTPVTGATFSYQPRCRPTVLYTGTHDGLIHAFRVDHLLGEPPGCEGVPEQADDEVGRELWAIAPQHLLRQSHALVGSYRYLMDGPLTLRDVLLSREDPEDADDAAEAVRWRSVLTAGYGVGGRGFIALDVTNALQGPQVMWEIDHEQRCRNGTCFDAASSAENDFSKLGLTSGQAAYATTFQGGREVSVAILPGGDSPEDATNPQAGRVVYVVDLETGEKIAEFSNDTGNVTDMSGGSETLPSPMTGSPAVYADTPGVVTTRAFIGDAGGRMWRLDMRQSDPEDWVLQLFFDPYAEGEVLEATNEVDRQPVLGAPAVALENAQGDLAVIYGTGNIDYVQQSTDSESGIFSISEIAAADGSFSASENWHRVFAPEEQLTGEPLVFAGVAYFTTYLVNTDDACDAGSGRLYGVHFSEPDPSASGDDTTFAALDEDGDPTTIDDVRFVTLAETVPFGVQVVERPACIPDATGTTPPTPAAGAEGGVVRGELQLVVNVAKGTGAGSPSTTPPTGAPKTRSVTRTLTASGETLQSSAWGYVLY